ncbi:MAG TPA: tetratricopeptide repeat protein, partial [Verrucomicrobiae bacterium]|nr:tetratricopeptide repeat protein [Verrucomicrobiae bacterium]
MLKKRTILLAIGLWAMIGAGCSPGARKAQYLQQADRDVAAGEYDRAEVEYFKVLRVDRDNPAAMGRLGTIYFEQERLQKSFPYLLKCSQLATNNLDVRVMLGRVYLAAGKQKEAQEQLNLVLDGRPDDAEAPILLAEMAFTPKDIEAVRQRLRKLPLPAAKQASVEVALATLSFREGDAKAAAAALERAKALDPKLSELHTALGNLHLTRNELKEAEQEFKAAADLAPARSQRRSQYVEFKIQTGDLEGARGILEEMVRKTPDYLPGWLDLAEIAAAQAKYDESAACLTKALARDPQNYKAMLMNGRLEMAKGETAKAITDLERMTSIYPKSPQAHYQLALAYLAGNETDRGVGSLNEALIEDPHFVEAILALAELRIRKGDTGSAVGMLRQLTGQQPKSAKAQLLLAEAYRIQGNLDDAVNVYRQLGELFPKSPEAPLLMGLVLAQQGNVGEARKAFSRAQEVAPNYLAALEQLVDLDLKEKQYATALHRVEQQLEKDPKEPEPPLLEAKIFLAQGMTNQAEAVLLKAVHAQPEFRGTYLMLAQLYVASNQHEKALTDLDQVLAKNSNDITAIMLKGMIHNEMKDYDKARNTYEKLLAINPNFSPALNNLAYLYSERFGQFDKALAMARHARELRPYDPATADTLGWILYQKHQYPQALSLLQESADKLPANSEIQFHLGMTHYMMGEEEAARNSLQRALQAGRDFPGKDEAGRSLSWLTMDVRTAGPDERAKLESRVARQPDDPIASLRLGAIYERDEAADKAAGAYQTVLTINPNNVKALASLARLYSSRLQQTAKGFELAKTAHKLAPEDPDISHLLGRAAYETGDYKWASSLLEEAARKEAGQPELLYDLALVRYSVGQVSDAQAAMLGALQGGAAFSHAAEARRFLDMVSLSANPSQAMASASQIEQIVKADGGYVPALMVMAAINEQKAGGGTAKQIYEKVLSKYPDFVPAEKRLAMLYAEDAGNDKKAYELAVKVREALPDDPEIAKALGIIIFRQGDYARAASLLMESDRKKSGDAQLMYYLGMAQYQLKQLTESKLTLQRALDMNPSAQLAAE